MAAAAVSALDSGRAQVRDAKEAEALAPAAAFDEIQATYAHLTQTFKSGRTKSYVWRAEQLQGLRRMILENSEMVIEAMRQDLGRPKAEAFIAEVVSVVGEINWILKRLKRWMAPEAMSTPMLQKPARSAIIREPRGLILDITPWNFPIDLSLKSMAAIISAGNCCVLKPSEVAPASEKFLKEMIPRYCDGDAIAVVTGGVPETKELLRLRWDHIMYTGNHLVAREVLAAAGAGPAQNTPPPRDGPSDTNLRGDILRSVVPCQQHLTPCTLELGGKCPTVVLPGANIPVAARRILAGKCLNAGQVCVAPDYALVHDSVAVELEAELKKTLSGWYGEDAKQSQSFARIVNGRHFRRVKSLVESAGQAVTHQLGQMDEAAKFVPPTLIKNPGDESAVMQEEIFGPILPFITCKSKDEIVARINEKEKPLAMYIFGREADADEIIQQTSSGGVCVNDTIFHMVTPEMPFGGVGFSGMGKYHGKWGFDEFSHIRSVMYRATWIDPPMRYPPYTDRNVRCLEKVMIGPLIPESLKRKLLAIGGAAAAAAAALVACLSCP